MPFYEYECGRCRYYLEVMQKISDAPLKKCPSCGKNALKKLVSAPVFRLKGSGWYETDFKSDQEGRRNLAGADQEAPATDAKAAAADGAKEGAAASSPDASKDPAKSTPKDGAAASGAPVKGAASAARPAKRAGRAVRPKAPARAPAKRAKAPPKRPGRRRGR